MKVRRVAEGIKPTGQDLVRLKQCGDNYYEIRFMQRKPVIGIERLDADQYMDKRSKEVKQITHHKKRTDDISSISRSISALRDLINANVEDPSKILWLTLTYSSNMQDVKKLYEDYKNFWKRLVYYLEKQGYPKPEYLTVVEPQGRGAYHHHVLLFFPKCSKRPYIPNEEMAKLWGHGFTKIKGLENIDNIGVYLSAYLGDLTVEEAVTSGSLHNGTLKEIVTKSGERKAILKGGRLHFYPAKFHLYRHSRGIKKPVIIENIREAEAQKIIGDAPLVYEKSIEIVDEGENIVNKITYRQYNRARHPEEDSGTPTDTQPGGPEAGATDSGKNEICGLPPPLKTSIENGDIHRKISSAKERQQ